MTDITADGGYVTTYSGRRFHILDPQPDEIDIYDIAWALSHVCRFTGHVKYLYTVAQHCVLVSYVCDPTYALQGLLHDASEAFICDVSRPVKYLAQMAGYRDIERVIQRTIYRKFGVSEEEHPSVKLADTRVLFTEKRDLLPVHVKWDWAVRPLPSKIVPWTCEKVRMMFMQRFLELTDYGKEA